MDTWIKEPYNLLRAIPDHIELLGVQSPYVYIADGNGSISPGHIVSEL